jgi:hypothetical protein
MRPCRNPADRVTAAADDSELVCLAVAQALLGYASESH